MQPCGVLVFSFQVSEYENVVPKISLAKCSLYKSSHTKEHKANHETFFSKSRTRNVGWQLAIRIGLGGLLRSPEKFE